VAPAHRVDDGRQVEFRCVRAQVRAGSDRCRPASPDRPPVTPIGTAAPILRPFRAASSCRPRSFVRRAGGSVAARGPSLRLGRRPPRRARLARSATASANARARDKPQAACEREAGGKRPVRPERPRSAGAHLIPTGGWWPFSVCDTSGYLRRKRTTAVPCVSKTRARHCRSQPSPGPGPDIALREGFSFRRLEKDRARGREVAPKMPCRSRPPCLFVRPIGIEACRRPRRTDPWVLVRAAAVVDGGGTGTVGRAHQGARSIFSIRASYLCRNASCIPAFLASPQPPAALSLARKSRSRRSLARA